MKAVVVNSTLPPWRTWPMCVYASRFSQSSRLGAHTVPFFLFSLSTS
jgi:hypothetical protein